MNILEKEERGIKYIISFRHHWWFDAGVAGMYRYAMYLLSSEPKWSKNGICVDITIDAIVFDSPNIDTLKSFFEACYEELASDWWNVSTTKQSKKKEMVLFNKKDGTLSCVSKRCPTPVAALSVAGGSSWRADGCKLDSITDEDLKKRIQDFCKEHGKKLWGTNNKLLWSKPVCHAKVDFFPANKKKICSVCGRSMPGCKGVTQTSYPLFSSENATFSFNSQLAKSDLICWECDLLGKFAVDSAHYKVNQNGILLIMQIYANRLSSLIMSHKKVGASSSIRKFDDIETLYYRNFGEKESIISWAALPYEMLFAFYLVAYSLTYDNTVSCEQDAEGGDYFYDEEILKAATQFGVVMLSIDNQGKTFITKELIDFNDSVYLFRLIKYINNCLFESKQFSDRAHSFFKGLFIDFNLVKDTQKKFASQNGMYRNDILKKVLYRQDIVRDVEKFVFKKSLIEEYPKLDRILFFTKHYGVAVVNETSYEGGRAMTKEQIEVAVNLGIQIVNTVTGLGGKNGDNLKQLKGDLFALRKTRTFVDFLDQLNRLQFRYGIVVNKEIIKGSLDTSGMRFEEFRAYCMISALNSFNCIMHTFGKSKDTELQKAN